MRLLGGVDQILGQADIGASMYTVGVDVGGPDVDDTVVIVKWHSCGRSESVEGRIVEPGVVELPVDVDIAEFIGASYGVMDSLGLINPTIELCRTCYHTLDGCECESGANF